MHAVAIVVFDSNRGKIMKNQSIWSMKVVIFISFFKPFSADSDRMFIKGSIAFRKTTSRNAMGNICFAIMACSCLLTSVSS